MSDTKYILVRYSRNAENSAGTGALKFHDDDRPDLAIGQAGYVTEAELHSAVVYGVILEPTDEESLQALNIAAPTHPDDLGDEPEVLADKPMSELKQIASDEDVDIKGLRSKEDVAEAIEAARSVQPEGVASLPATATTGPPAPLSGAGASGSSSDSGGASTPAGAAITSSSTAS